MSIGNIHNNRFTIILVEPRDDANVGAAARALKNCGFANLTIVRRRKPGPRARRMAVHSEDVLDGARRFVNFNDALAKIDFVAGFTARARRFGPKLVTFDAAAAARLNERAANGNVALVFGPEDSGLSDEHVGACSALYNIPASPARPIYNLSQAVMIVTHTLAFQNISLQKTAAKPQAPEPRASRAEIDSLLKEFERVLTVLRYPPSRRPHDRTARILARIRLQMERACAEEADLQLWRGLLARIRS